MKKVAPEKKNQKKKISSRKKLTPKKALKKMPLVNRDISWLTFNDRVLQEAEDKSNPLIERLRFLGIYSNNMDEFFRVRIATIKRLIKLGKKAVAILGLHPKKLLVELQKRVLISSGKFDKIYSALLIELEAQEIYIVDELHLNNAQGAWVREYFLNNILPTLFPIMLDSTPKFPYLKDKSIYFAIELERKEKKKNYALIEVSGETLPRFITIPSSATKKHVILIDDVIRYCLKDIFSSIEYVNINAFTIKLTRDAELDLDNDISKSFVEKITGGIKNRKKGDPVRFLYDKTMPKSMLLFLRNKLKVIKKDNVIAGARYHNFKDFINFPTLGHKELTWPEAHPLSHPRFLANKSIFKSIGEKDILLHFPYQSFHHVIDLLREASIDPRVKKIQITLYRVTKNSSIVNALINAVKNGKEVVVIMELQARFDEENNILWANKLMEEGARVIFGVPGIKVHSKIFLISRKEKGGLVEYAYTGTGNFNESTSKIYTDKALLTIDKRITEEVRSLFDFYTDNLKPGVYKNLVVAPFDMRKRIEALIQKEIDNSFKGKPAWIILKLNNLIDRDIIAKLYEASSAGVKIKLMVRGACSLVPKVKGYSENIELLSIVGRYLEHTRVFIFCNGGDEKYFISSADWMSRNLDYRSEVAVPIYDIESQQEMKHILDLQFRDNKKARVFGRGGENLYRTNKSSKHLVAQDEIRRFLDKKSKMK